jgi:hypothetical protein
MRDADFASVDGEDLRGFFGLHRIRLAWIAEEPQRAWRERAHAIR